MSNDANDQGDGPDTIDGRLAVVARLIDTLRDETDEDRRRARRAVVVELLARLGRDVLARIAAELDRLERAGDADTARPDQTPGPAAGARWRWRNG